MRFKILLSVIVGLGLLLVPSAVVLAQTSEQTGEQLQQFLGDYPLEELRQKYCDDRKGNVINLQTWYSGKCTGDATDPESMGFSDIVLLDFYTLLVGEPGGNPRSNTGGALPIAANLLTNFYKRPAVSTADYLAYLGDNLAKHSIIQPAYAQGTGYGFQSLSPILPIWRAMRNATYILFTLGFVIYGFMIMFRIKLGPQAAVTIQTALPKLILTLLLITFSYAIVGLLIDLSYIIMGIVFSILSGTELISDRIRAEWGTGGVGMGELLLRVFAHFIFGLPNKILNAILGLPPALQGIVDVLLIGGVAAVGILSGGLILILLAIILVIFILYIFIKILFTLLDALIKIILGTIFAPFILLTGLLPGQNAFASWLREMIANIAAFPAMVIMLTLALIFMGKYYVVGIDISGTPGVGDLFNAFSPPEISGQNFWAAPIIGGSRNVESIFGLIGLGFFWMAPKVADEVRKALKASPAQLVSSLGDALGGAIRTAGLSTGRGQFQKFAKARGWTSTP